MANRRMFSCRIIGSARFLKMPISSQALYFHLGLHADDDGVVEAYNVIKQIGCSEDDLRVLVSKGFVQVLNEDLVSYITDWNENNYIRADRKIDSIYKDLLISMNPEVHLIEKRPRADVKPKLIDTTYSGQLDDGQPMDNQWTTNGQPMDGIGKDRLGKDRLGKDRLGECRTEESEETVVSTDTRSKKQKEPKHTYGEYSHVKLTDSEIDKLHQEYGLDMTQTCITFLDEYIEMKGYKAKSHYLCIRKWVVDAVKERQQKANRNGGSSKVADDLSKDYERYARWAEGK